MTAVLQVGNQTIQADEMLTLLKRYQVLPQVIRGIVIDEAIATQTWTEAEQQQAIATLKHHHKLESAATFATWLQQNDTTPEQFAEMALRPILLEKFKQSQWSHLVDSYFLKRKSALDHVIYSLIRTKDFGLANELYFRILDGEQSFEELARKYSQGAEAHAGGVLGPVPLSQPHPAIAKLLAASQPGKVLMPRLLGDWVVILRLEKLVPAQMNEGMQQQMLNEMFEQWVQTQVEERLKAVAGSGGDSEAERVTRRQK